MLSSLWLVSAFLLWWTETERERESGEFFVCFCVQYVCVRRVCGWESRKEIHSRAGIIVLWKCIYIVNVFIDLQYAEEVQRKSQHSNHNYIYNDMS